MKNLDIPRTEVDAKDLILGVKRKDYFRVKLENGNVFKGLIEGFGHEYFYLPNVKVRIIDLCYATEIMVFPEEISNDITITLDGLKDKKTAEILLQKIGIKNPKWNDNSVIVDLSANS